MMNLCIKELDCFQQEDNQIVNYIGNLLNDWKQGKDIYWKHQVH